MKKAFFSMGLFAFAIAALAQNTRPVIDKPLKFGFAMGFNRSIIIDKGIPQNALIEDNLGLRLGIFADYEVRDFFFIAPRAELSFNNGQVNFNNADGSSASYVVMPVALEFMTHFVFKKQSGKLSPYFLLGPNFKIPVPGEPNNTANFPSRNDFAIDLGIGIDRVFHSFIFSPELRYSYGLLDVNENPAIEAINFHSVSLVLNLKG